MKRLRSIVGALAAIAMSGSLAAATPAREQLAAAVQANHRATVKKLQEWIAQATITAERREFDQGAAHMARLARDAGFQHVRIVPTPGAPAVFATLDAGAKDTLALYFMYDVKQFDPAEWSSPPLEARLVDRPQVGKVMIGRGAINQKGPQIAFLAAVEAFRRTGRKLPVNLVLVAEGEEEVGSTNLSRVVADPEVAAALRRSVGIFMPSGGQNPDGKASIDLGAKGAIELQLIASGAKSGIGPKGDIHSGQAARVDNPAWRLVKALDTLVADDGFTPTIDGILEHVRPLTAREKSLIAANLAEVSEAEAKKSLGIQRWIGGIDFRSASERLAGAPTVNIQGLVSGYTGPGGKTIVPGRAEAKLDLRLVPNMTSDDVLRKLKAHLARRGFGDIEVVVLGPYDPTSISEDSVLIRAQKAALDAARIPYSIHPRRPGSWPGVVFSGPPLNMAAGHAGIGRGGSAHAPDEWYLIESAKPKVAGLEQATMYYVDFLYQLAEIAAKERR